MKFVVFLGAPGTGKGTQSQYFEKKGCRKISTGDILRDYAKIDSTEALKLKKIIDSGELVPDNMVSTIVQSNIQNDKIHNKFIFDGYPRTIGQAEILDDILYSLESKLDLVVYFNLSIDQLVERLTSRYVCSGCGTTYNNFSHNPKIMGICDKCDGKKFFSREDDSPATVRNRISVFLENTQPLIEYYKKKGIFKEVNAGKEIKEINQEIDLLFKITQIY